MACTDLFIVLDDVQYIRRGFVHRNRLLKSNGEEDWLTLPIAKASLEEKIDKIRIRMDDGDEWAKRSTDKFPVLKTDITRYTLGVLDLKENLRDYLWDLIVHTARLHLGLHVAFKRSSDLDIPKGVIGQDRIISLVKAVGCKRYVNTVGGRHLYSHDEFKRHGLELKFLTPYVGSHLSILERLNRQAESEIKREIEENTILED
jgi:hypothetical protein